MGSKIDKASVKLTEREQMEFKNEEKPSETAGLASVGPASIKPSEKPSDNKSAL